MSELLTFMNNCTRRAWLLRGAVQNAAVATSYHNSELPLFLGSWEHIQLPYGFIIRLWKCIFSRLQVAGLI
jgi:uncharacterized protein with PQ loop repeat